MKVLGLAFLLTALVIREERIQNICHTQLLWRSKVIDKKYMYHFLKYPYQERILSPRGVQLFQLFSA